MIYVSFREYHDDVFADAFPFLTKEEASVWFNPQYHKWREEKRTVISLKEWPTSKNIEPSFTGEYVKGYKVERKGEKDLWILITKEII